MKLKRLLVFVAVIGFVAASVHAQSAQPRVGSYKYETSTVLHQIYIADAGDGKYEIGISSTNGTTIRVYDARWRSGSGAIEFVHNGRTVQIRAERGGRSISCSLFGSVILDRA